MSNTKLWTALGAVAVLLLGAQNAGAQSRDQLVEKFTPLAGSQANASTLVNGLSNGSTFTISGTTFNPPTHKLGNGEVNISLSLAQAELKQQGIAQPTTQQLQAALIGTSSQPCILALRAEGKGWGQIAQTLGVKLGDVVRSEKADKAHDRVARGEQAERRDRAEKPERPERPDRPERAERPERPERAAR